MAKKGKKEIDDSMAEAASEVQEEPEDAGSAKRTAVKKALEKEHKGLAELIMDACDAFGVALEYLFASSIEKGIVTLLTNGGKKVRYEAGDKVEKLDDIAITGINPALKKRKVIAGKAKK